MQYELIDNKLN